MTEHQNSNIPANDDTASNAVDCTEETAQRAGAKQTSLKHDDAPSTEPEIDKDDVSEADLDEAIEESMDASDPPSFTQP